MANSEISKVIETLFEKNRSRETISEITEKVVLDVEAFRKKGAIRRIQYELPGCVPSPCQNRAEILGDFKQIHSQKTSEAAQGILDDAFTKWKVIYHKVAESV